jgi:DNA modification methylase
MDNWLGPYHLGPDDRETFGIYHGDCRDLTTAIPDHSIQCIFTDPPYQKVFLPLYAWLAQETPRLLTPDGFLLVYSGGYWKDVIMAMMRETLEYWWDYQTKSTESPVIWQRMTVAKVKSILVYRPPGGIGQPQFGMVLGLWEGGTQDKAYHTWSQPESTQRYFTQAFAAPTGIVLDPFCGGGTCPAICAVTGHRWLAFDNDTDAVERSRLRVSRQLDAPPPACNNSPVVQIRLPFAVPTPADLTNQAN